MGRCALRRRRPLASRVRGALRALLAFLFSNVGVTVLVVGYVIAGAFMFQAIEGGSERERGNLMVQERDNTAQYLWQNVTLKYNPLNETAVKNSIQFELRRYQRVIVWSVRRGWDGGRSSRQWSFSSAFLYSLTVITTIGYGHLSPRTSWGKVTTIFYALLGMPLFLLYLTNVGELLARWFKCLYALVCLCRGCRGCPGFSRRRMARLRAQMEISEAESIERPDDWRHPHSDIHVAPERYPGRYFIERVPYRNDRDAHQRCVDDRYQPQPRHYLDRYPNYRIPCRQPVDYRYVGRHRDNYRGFLDTYPSERYNEEITISDLRYVKPYRGLQRQPDYLRSTSVPYPANHRIPEPRGWSEPAFRSDDSVTSDFSVVSFDAQTITVPLSVCVAIMVGYIMFGSMVFGLWEEWGQLDGAYFCFISLSSIGFGDFVPGERIYTPRIETSFIVCSMYLMLGMALVAMCFNLMQEQVIHYVAALKRAARRACCRCRCKR